MSHPVALALPSAAQHPKAAEDLTRRPPGSAAREGADDAGLMAGAGDRAAFDLLVARHGERALRLALRVLGGPTEAEEVAQEAFLRAWRAAARFDPDRARFSTWLHRIALNLAIDRARRRGTAPPALDLAEDLPDPAAGPDASLDAAAERAAPAELPPRQRAAVALAYEAGPSGAEAAAALPCPNERWKGCCWPGRAGPGSARRRRAGLQPYGGTDRERALPEADRPAFRAVFDAERARCEGALAEVRAAREEVDAAMAREPFDPASLRSAMAARSNRRAAVSAAFADTVTRAMAAIPPQGRAQVAAARRRDG
jgi:RNA polymerase sigma-70 factor (ECF subfamily)